MISREKFIEICTRYGLEYNKESNSTTTTAFFIDWVRVALWKPYEIEVINPDAVTWTEFNGDIKFKVDISSVGYGNVLKHTPAESDMERYISETVSKCRKLKRMYRINKITKI